MNTREKIIYESLNLFSRKGFDAVSVRDIASAVGIKASSLYNHFKNKQDIFDTIVDKYSEHINNFFNHLKSEESSNGIDLNKINWVSEEQFLKNSVNIFSFYLYDEYIVKFRKLLTIEQFNNSKLANLYNQLFIDDILDFQSKIFTALIKLNIFIKKDPYTLALQFYSPVFLLSNKAECITKKERESLRNHLSDFQDLYMVKG